MSSSTPFVAFQLKFKTVFEFPMPSCKLGFKFTNECGLSVTINVFIGEIYSLG